MDLALLALRLALGVGFVAHGAQKLFGAFGGQGLNGTAGCFEQIASVPGSSTRGWLGQPSSWEGP